MTHPTDALARISGLEARIGDLERRLDNASALLKEMSTNASYNVMDVAWYLSQALSTDSDKKEVGDVGKG